MNGGRLVERKNVSETIRMLDALKLAIQAGHVRPEGIRRSLEESRGRLEVYDKPKTTAIGRVLDTIREIWAKAVIYVCTPNDMEEMWRLIPSEERGLGFVPGRTFGGAAEAVSIMMERSRRVLSASMLQPEDRIKLAEWRLELLDEQMRGLQSAAMVIPGASKAIANGINGIHSRMLDLVNGL